MDRSGFWRLARPGALAVAGGASLAAAGWLASTGGLERPSVLLVILMVILAAGPGLTLAAMVAERWARRRA